MTKQQCNKQALRKLLPKEWEEQIALVQWMSLRFDYYEFYAPLSEQKAQVQRYTKLQKMGLKKGFFDILIFRSVPYGGYKGVAIQLKRQLPVASAVMPEQKLWDKEMRNKNGWFTMICYGAQDAITQIKNLYNIK